MRFDRLDKEFFLSRDLQHNLPNANLAAPQADLDAWVAECERTATIYGLLKKVAFELFEEEGYSRNDRLYYDAVELLKKAKTMRRIQSLWAQEDDYSSDDDWFLTRANDYIHALYTTPADQLASFVSTLGFRGLYLTHGICDGLGLELRQELDYRQTDFCFYGCQLKPEDIVVPFDAHSIWDALLLLLSVQWMWKPEMWFIADVGGKKLYPRISIFGQQALVTFCTVSAEPMKDTTSHSIYKTGVLLIRRNDTFSVKGAYRVRIGETEEPRLPEPPEHIPPFHLFTEEEQPLIEEARSKVNKTDDLPF